MVRIVRARGILCHMQAFYGKDRHRMAAEFRRAAEAQHAAESGSTRVPTSPHSQTKQIRPVAPAGPVREKVIPAARLRTMEDWNAFWRSGEQERFSTEARLPAQKPAGPVREKVIPAARSRTDEDWKPFWRSWKQKRLARKQKRLTTEARKRTRSAEDPGKTEADIASDESYPAVFDAGASSPAAAKASTWKQERLATEARKRGRLARKQKRLAQKASSASSQELRHQAPEQLEYWPFAKHFPDKKRTAPPRVPSAETLPKKLLPGLVWPPSLQHQFF